MSKTLPEVIEQIVTCQRCELSQHCKSPVPVAVPSAPAQTSQEPTQTAQFIVLGEAPGRVEDHRGVPFLGQAGQLLRNQLKINEIHKQAYFMNAVSCWPRFDQHPNGEQLRACRGNLKDQLEVADAKYVLAAGGVAVQALIPHTTITHTAGRLIPIHGKLVFPILHPSFIIRKNDPTLQTVWEESIHLFSFILHWQLKELEVDDCLYCPKIRYGELPTCYKHRKDWRKDQVWDKPRGKKKKLEQEGLF